MSRLDGPTNMALDRALLEAAEGKGQLGWRVYGWDGPWLTMGMNQDPSTELLPTNPVPWVMRPTGGKAVLHGHDVTVGFAAPHSSIWPLEVDGETRARSVRAAYRWVTRPIIEALCECRLPCDLAENVAGTVWANLPVGPLVDEAIRDTRYAMRATESAAQTPEFLAKAQSSKGLQREDSTSGPLVDEGIRDARYAMRATESAAQTPEFLAKAQSSKGLQREDSTSGPLVDGAVRDTQSNFLNPKSKIQKPKSALLNPQSSIRNPQSADCFLGVSPNDIVDLRTGQKACGCAFRMTKRAVLLQASIPAGEPLIDPAEVFSNPSLLRRADWEFERFVAAFAAAVQRLCSL